jgi:hypothetical protein
MAIDTGIGISITQTSATQQAPLGQTVLKPAGTNGEGEQVWIYVQALEALVVGNVVVRNAAAAPTIANTLTVTKSITGMPADAVVGVAQHAISLNYYGWVLQKGQGQVLTDGAGVIIGGLGIAPGAAVAGTAEGSAPTANAFGYALENSAVGTLCKVVLNCPSS